jgi:uncharacterized protein YkwD
MRRFRIFFLLLFMASASLAGAQKFILPEFSLNKAEETLYRMINEYRAKKGLAPVPLSRNLTYVAKLHVQDLAENLPYNQRCNLHSWSGQGPWTACCYTEDHEQAACMWNKPGEVSNYPGFGYEIAYWTNEQLNSANFAKKALSGWQRSVPHNIVMVNQGRWKSKNWKAMGVGVYKGYATVWFGEEGDTEELIIDNK